MDQAKNSTKLNKKNNFQDKNCLKLQKLDSSVFLISSDQQSPLRDRVGRELGTVATVQVTSLVKDGSKWRYVCFIHICHVIQVKSMNKSKVASCYVLSLFDDLFTAQTHCDQACRRDFYRADSADAGPVRLLVHSGRLVNLTEEEVDLLLELLGGRDYGCTGKLRIW